jgi:hypothetical protein
MVTDMGIELTLKNGCLLMAAAPSFPDPNRFLGSLSKNLVTISAACDENSNGISGI